MKLTGKCKESFLDYLSKNKKLSIQVGVLRIHWPEYPKEYLNSLTIDFFDSVGIYVTILPCIDKTFDSYITMNEKRTEVCQFQENRTKATNAAITAANEIFNLNNK